MYRTKETANQNLRSDGRFSSIFLHFTTEVNFPSRKVNPLGKNGQGLNVSSLFNPVHLTVCFKMCTTWLLNWVPQTLCWATLTFHTPWSSWKDHGPWNWCSRTPLSDYTQNQHWKWSSIRKRVVLGLRFHYTEIWREWIDDLWKGLDRGGWSFIRSSIVYQHLNYYQ